MNARKRNFRAALEREKGKVIPDVGNPTNEPVDAAKMYNLLGYNPGETQLSGGASLLGSPIDSLQAIMIREEAANIATRLAHEGAFPLYSNEWDVFRHG